MALAGARSKLRCGCWESACCRRTRAVRAWGWQQQQAGLEQFVSQRAERVAVASAMPAARDLIVPAPDRTLWSAGRVQAYEAAASLSLAPAGVLRMPSIGLVVPIYEGTSDSVLNRGAGRIEGTAALDEQGNIGLAAHRDGFFRALKDIRLGDVFTLDTLRASYRYRVTELLVTEPTDTSVIARTPTASVTLVTCYPFYFVGSAPKRYIVRAERIAP